MSQEAKVKKNERVEKHPLKGVQKGGKTLVPEKTKLGAQQKRIIACKTTEKRVKDTGSEPSEVQKQPDGIDSENSFDLSSPGLYSALQLANEIQAASAENVKVEELKLFQEKHVEEAIKQKAMKKANVPFSKNIFKDLIDLHISDEDIPSGKNTHPKNVNFSTNKDPVFHLEDFYKPDFSTEFCVKIPEQKFEVEKIEYYNGFELYERIESLKNLVKE